MRAFLALALCLAPVLAAADQGASSATRDDAAIRAVVKQYVDARERNDAAAIRALFTEDADQLTSSGEWRKGREDVVSGTLRSSQGAPGTRTINIETVRYPAAGVAIADGRYEIAGDQQNATRRMWTSFVFVRNAGAWRIAAIRNMLPAPLPAPAK
jgi:conserved hypothetical protein